MSYEYSTVVLNPLDPDKNSKTHRTLFYGTPRSKKARAETVFKSFKDSSKPLNLTRDTFYAALNQVDLSKKEYRDALLAGMQNFPELRKLILSEAFPGLLKQPSVLQNVNLSGITLAELGLTRAEKIQTLGTDEWAKYGWTSAGHREWEQDPAHSDTMNGVYTQKVPATIDSNRQKAKQKLKALFDNIDFAYRAFNHSIDLTPAAEINIPELATLCVNYLGIGLAALQSAQYKQSVFNQLTADQINTLANNTRDLPYKKRKIYFPSLVQALCSLNDPSNQDKKLDLLSRLKNSQNPIADLSLLQDYVKAHENTANEATALKKRITDQAPEIFVALMEKTGNSSKIVNLMKEYIIEFIDGLPAPLTPESARQLKLLFNPQPINGAVPIWTDFLNLPIDKVQKIANVFDTDAKKTAFVNYHCPQAAENPRKKHPVWSLINRIFGVWGEYFSDEFRPLKQECEDKNTYKQWDDIIAGPERERAAAEQTRQTALRAQQEEAQRLAQQQEQQRLAAVKAQEEAERVAAEQTRQTALRAQQEEAQRLAQQQEQQRLAAVKAQEEAERAAEEQRLAREREEAERTRQTEETQRLSRDQTTRELPRPVQAVFTGKSPTPAAEKASEPTSSSRKKGNNKQGRTPNNAAEKDSPAAATSSPKKIVEATGTPPKQNPASAYADAARKGAATPPQALGKPKRYNAGSSPQESAAKKPAPKKYNAGQSPDTSKAPPAKQQQAAQATRGATGSGIGRGAAHFNNNQQRNIPRNRTQPDNLIPVGGVYQPAAGFKKPGVNTQMLQKKP